MTVKIYRHHYSCEGWRPNVDFMDDRNSANDVLGMRKYLRGAPDAPPVFPPIHVVVEHPNAREWDYYGHMGDYGVISSRALEVLQPFAAPCFDFFEISLNAAPYFVPRLLQTIDCLDHDRSVIEWSNRSLTYIKWIHRYAFDTSLLENIGMFTFPERFAWMYATEPVIDAVRTAGLRGFDPELVYSNE